MKSWISQPPPNSSVKTNAPRLVKRVLRSAKLIPLLTKNSYEFKAHGREVPENNRSCYPLGSLLALPSLSLTFTMRPRESCWAVAVVWAMPG